MGYDFSGLTYSSVKATLNDILRAHENAHELKREFQRYHAFANTAGASGLHEHLAYYWGSGEVTPKNDSNSLGQTILDCSDDYVFKADAIWLLTVTLFWQDDLRQRGLEGQMYLRGDPAAASPTYHAFLAEPALYGQGAGCGTFTAAPCVVATAESSLPAEFALLLEHSAISLRGLSTRGDGSARNWGIRARVSDYWGATVNPGTVRWDASLVRLG